MGGQARGGGDSGAIVRSLSTLSGSGSTPDAATVVSTLELATGTEITIAHEIIDAHDPGAHGSRQGSFCPRCEQSEGMPASDASGCAASATPEVAGMPACA